MFLIPYRIESLPFVRPWANWLIVGACTWVSLAAFRGEIPDETLEKMVADGMKTTGLFGHMLLHGDYLHLAGNMLVLWIFGNAVCGMIGNFAYLVAFPLCGALAATIHHYAVGGPMIGASGAINGVVGFVLAICPLNRVTVCFCLLMPSATFTMPAWSLILIWLGFDVRGALNGTGFIAYWAHPGALSRDCFADSRC
jgi:membrane associated rhomboid family serine protease